MTVRQLPPGIDATRLDLAREFKARPFGAHSGDLQHLLNVMRGLPIENKHVLVMTEPHRQWTLAEMTGEPPRPRLLSNHVFHSLEEAEWHVFKLRWRELIGEPLELE